MRNIILLFLLAWFSPTQSQSVQFATEMNLAVKLFDAAATPKDYQTVLLKLDPIAKSNTTEWLPLYYMSLVKSRMSMMKMGNTDELANQS